MPHVGLHTQKRTSEHQKPYDRPKKVICFSALCDCFVSWPCCLYCNPRSRESKKDVIEEQLVVPVYGHFGPKTLRTQGISALCVWCQSVSHFCVGAEVFIWCRSVQWTHRSVSDRSALKYMRHFGPRIKICLECVLYIEPLYIRYSNGIVFGK